MVIKNKRNLQELKEEKEKIQTELEDIRKKTIDTMEGLTEVFEMILT